MKNFLVKLGLFLAKLGGYIHKVEEIDEDLQKVVAGALPYVAMARAVVTAVEAKFVDVSGEFKKSEAERVMMNKFPSAVHRHLSLAIEMAVEICST